MPEGHTDTPQLEYILQTIVGCCSLCGVSVCPSGTGLGHVHFLRYVFVLDIFCQQLWGVVHLVECLCALRAQGWVMYIFLDMCLYWIYSANNCGVLFT